MPTHTKPTKEELEAGILKAQEEAEALKDNPPIDEPVLDPKPDPEPKPESEVEPEPAPEPEPEVDRLKKKFSASARENQKILAKNRKLNQAIDETNEIPEPTEEELTKEYSKKLKEKLKKITI